MATLQFSAPGPQLWMPIGSESWLNCKAIALLRNPSRSIPSFRSVRRATGAARECAPQRREATWRPPKQSV